MSRDGAGWKVPQTLTRVTEAGPTLRKRFPTAEPVRASVVAPPVLIRFPEQL
jgi:hypothetical protein